MILFSIALDFIVTTRHIHNCVSFLLWLSIFIPPEVISPLFSTSILDTYWPGGLSFSIVSFCLFILFMGFSCLECWSGLPFPSPVDHVLSDLSTMTCPSWVALHGMAHSFIKLYQTVIHVMILVSFLWFWFSLCLLSDRWGQVVDNCQNFPGNNSLLYCRIKYCPV